MRLTRAWMTWALGVAIGASGCTIEIRDPVGSDASIEGSWTVDSAAPTPASCAANGITHVRVRVWDGDTYFDPPELVFPCEDGSFDTVDPVLRDGEWSLQLLALDANADDVVVAEGPLELFDTLREAGHIVMTPVDFVGAAPATSMQASWTINGAAPTVDSCASLGIDEILVQIVSGAGAGTELKYMCDEGSFVAEIDPGDYEVRVVASSLATGELTATELTESFTVADGERHVINGGPIDYIGGFDPLGTDAALQASWTIGGNLTDAVVCDAVAATTVDFIFYPADDAARETEGVVVHAGAPCDPGNYVSAAPILAEGSYLVSTELLADGGAVISRVDQASPITVTAGAPAVVDVDFRLDSSTLHAVLQYKEPLGTEAGSCSDATTDGVGMVYWEVFFDNRATGTPIADSGGDVPCVDFVNVMSGPAGAELAPGTYELYYEGALPGMPTVKRWAGSCFLTIDAAGGLGIAECIADFMT